MFWRSVSSKRLKTVEREVEPGGKLCRILRGTRLKIQVQTGEYNNNKLTDGCALKRMSTTTFLPRNLESPRAMGTALQGTAA